ncbi:MAG: PQQ-binding-like beta-propeller repeat protein [Acidobacteriota bacterium]
MTRNSILIAIGASCLLATLALVPPPTRQPAPNSDADRFWPQWRGPDATGVAPSGDPPLRWSESRNVRWKVEIPGKGSASPIVWGDRIFVLTAIPESNQTGTESAVAAGQRRRRRGPPNVAPTSVEQFTVLAISRDDGAILWQRVAREETPHEGRQPNNTWASSSAVTDGEHVYAYFGSRGLYAYDMQGSLEWEKDLGEMRIRLGFGEGSSPALQGDKIVINWDHEGQSFIVALDKKTGEELWRTDRDEITSWSTPLIVAVGGKYQVVTSATRRVRSYDLETGTLIWESAGLTLNAIPSPVAADGMVFVTSGFRGNILRAIRLADARADISDSGAIAWEYDRDTPYVPSPLLFDNNLYVIKSNSNILSSLDAKTGEKHFGPQRLERMGGIFSSPVGAAGRVYISDRDGNTVVIDNGPELRVLARNSLDDGFDASAAIVDKEIYLRGHRYLYRISEQ